MIIELRNLTYRTGTHTLLKALTLAPTSTKNLVLIGPSGSGKSTLLRVLSGLLPPTNGTALLDGTPLPVTESERLAHRRSTGFVFQSFNLFPHLTALGNLTLPLTAAHQLHPLEAENAPSQNSTDSASKTTQTAPQRSYPVDNVNASPSHAHSSSSRACCCWMNPPPPWIL